MRKKHSINSTLVLSCCLLFSAGSLFAQKTEFTITTREMVIPCGDSTIQSFIYLGQAPKNLDPERYYYWINQNGIVKNKGYYVKNPLHGNYLVFDAGNKLIAQGQHTIGLRTGIWTRWYPSGEALSIEYYKDGLFHGNCRYFADNGAIRFSRNYKHGELHGKQYEYLTDSTVILVYKRGVLVPRKDARTHKPFFRKRKVTVQPPPPVVPSSPKTNSSDNAEEKDNKPKRPTIKKIPVK